jgi:hypothetical protein
MNMMKSADEYAAQSELESLVEIWKVLEMLTVSLDRLGMHEALYGAEQGQAAMRAFLKQPELFTRISTARSAAQVLLIAQDPSLEQKLQDWSDDEAMMGYWQSPSE